MAETSIEWTDFTFNPWMGCAKAHAGCTNCYATTQTPVRTRGIAWGEVWQGGQRVIAADSTWKHPLAWARAAAKAGERRRVFCASLADVLEVPTVPEEWPSSWTEAQRDLARGNVAITAKMLDAARARLWDVIRDTAGIRTEWSGTEGSGTTWNLKGFGLDWLLLTKRPENWALVPEDVRSLVWLGTSISDQRTADEWVPRLLQADGFRLRFLSVEPLVGPVDLSRWLKPVLHTNGCERLSHPDPRIPSEGGRWEWPIFWVIVGGESGPRARPCNVEWVRDIVRQCREAAVPVLVKQLGSNPAWTEEMLTDHMHRAYDAIHGHGPDAWPVVIACDDAKGCDMNEWPEDLRVREFPCL